MDEDHHNWQTERELIQNNQDNEEFDEDCVKEFCARYGEECGDLETFDLHGNEKYVTQEHKPFIGMKFQSDDDAYDYYNLYAKKAGFGVRKDKVFHSKLRKCITSRTYVCAKEGHKKMDKRSSGPHVKSRREIREGCEAMMRIKLVEDDIWVVDAFKEEHNHLFVTPSKIAKIRSHKKFTATTKSLIDTLSKSIGPSKIASALTTTEGHGSVVVSSQDTRNYLRKIKKTNLGKDCMSVIKSFIDRQAKDDGFYFEAEVDEEYRMRSVFWVDGRSRMTYHQFGDVVVFDTTYRTNTYSMPFAPFTGVNHHRQSILFGCGLLADETEETFTWLFQTWLKAMGGKKPVSIITDQDGAMTKAIHNVFEGTQHRYCMWHIGQNEIRHLNGIKLQHYGFDVEYNRCKYSETIKEFEKSWAQLIERYGLQENSWLKSMYEVRCHWIPCYMKDTFFAGMSTTQRSESINSFFDGYVSAKTPLNEFVNQYDKALTHRRDQENHEDHITLYTKPSFISMNPLEVQAGKVYTRHVFERFQAEFQKLLSYMANKCGEDGYISTYRVGTYGSEMKYVVKFDERDKSVTCSCKKFEFEGLLCSHILKVYQKMDVFEISFKYFLTRWTIKARYGHVRPIELDDNTLEYVTPMMVWNVREAALKSIDLGIRSVEHYKVVMPALINLVGALDSITLSPKEYGSNHDDNLSNAQTSIPVTEQVRIHIRDPESSITKGRPKSSVRIRSSLEEALHKAKQRACGHCKRKGHYISTCPYKKMMSSEVSVEDHVFSQASNDATATQNSFEQ